MRKVKRRYWAKPPCHPERRHYSHGLCRRCYALWSRYGLTQDAYNLMLEGQNFGCAICSRPFTNTRTPYVDHNHKTGSVRGILCRECNTGIGMLQDDGNVMLTACLYVLHRT